MSRECGLSIGSLSKLSHRTTEGDVKDNVRQSLQRWPVKDSSDGARAGSTAWIETEGTQGHLCRSRRQFSRGGEHSATASSTA